jgi:SAM-dependent methyltransferase
VGEILAFNWHWYAIGGVSVLAGLMALQWMSWSVVHKTLGCFGLAVAVLWTAGSLAVSHWIYDRSPLREWTWIKALLPNGPRRWCNIHCGLDESSETLRSLFPNSSADVLDIFNPAEMTEPSIARARKRSAEICTPADAQDLPLADASCDAVFLLFTAHELRSPEAREAFFRETRRVLASDGRIIVTEHLRDGPNFCAFGPGAFHFFSRREWLRVFDRGSLALVEEFSITPFVRIFVLRRAT